MDKYEATKTLTGKLAEHFGTLVVSDDVYKDQLVKKAQHVYVIGNPIDVGLYRDGSQILYIKKDANNKCIESKKLEDVITEFIPAGTNYIFSSSKVMMNENRLVFNVTPYSIIGDKEIEALKSMFYKKYDINAKEALDTLGIKNFFELYQSYFNNDTEFQKLLFNNFENFKKELLDFLKDCKYDGDGDTKLEAFESKFGLSNLNSQFKKLGINFHITTENKYIKRNEVNRLTKLLEEHDPLLSAEGSFSLEFLKFVFTLPYEDQNIEMNKSLLKKFNHILDLKTLLLKEFKQGKHFKEYFELLEDNKQEEIVKIIKQSGFQNSDINHYLWMMGSKDIRLDYLKLYKEEAEEFISYFKDRPSEEKKVILNDIMECDFINDKVTEWLNQNESDLIREVGFNF